MAEPVISRMSHTDAREVCRAAWRRRFGREATLFERQIIQAWGQGETGYGSKLGGFNWGSVTAKVGEPGFLANDTRPALDGSTIKYRTKFRSYASHVEGCEDMIRVISLYDGALEAARLGDALGFARALFRPLKPGYEVGYYAGIAKDPPERRPVRRAAEIVGYVVNFARVLGEDALTYGGPFPTLQKGASTAVVAGLGDMSVIAYQKSRGLVADGILGPTTRGWLFVDPEVDEPTTPTLHLCPTCGGAGKLTSGEYAAIKKG